MLVTFEPLLQFFFYKMLDRSEFNFLLIDPTVYLSPRDKKSPRGDFAKIGSHWNYLVGLGCPPTATVLSFLLWGVCAYLNVYVIVCACHYILEAIASLVVIFSLTQSLSYHLVKLFPFLIFDIINKCTIHFNYPFLSNPFLHNPFYQAIA